MISCVTMNHVTLSTLIPLTCSEGERRAALLSPTVFRALNEMPVRHAKVLCKRAVLDCGPSVTDSVSTGTGRPTSFGDLLFVDYFATSLFIFPIFCMLFLLALPPKELVRVELRSRSVY